MIEVTRMDGRPILINENLIETVEANPDTVIIMTNGRKIIVQDTVTDILNKCNEISHA